MSVVVENIFKNYGTQVALNNISFNIQSGDIVGFLGPNGAGKSTMMKILTGFISPDKGKAYISGHEVETGNLLFKSKIGYLPENNPLYHEMYVREYLSLAAGFYKIKNKDKTIDNYIDLTGLTYESHKKIGALSKGYKQRVGLAQALLHDPDVLILDEPTTGLDPNQLDEIRTLIKEVSKNKTVLLSTHIMQEVEAICNRVMIIDKGNIIADDTTEEIKRWSKIKTQQIVFAVLENIDEAFFNNLPFIKKADRINDKEYLLYSSVEDDIRPLLFKTAVKNNLTIITMTEKSGSVESIFRELTQS